MKKQAESIKNIRQFRQDINKRLDELENASVAAMEQKYAEMINKIEEAMRLITESKRDVDSAQDKLRAAGNNVSQAFVSEKIARTVATKAIECLTEQRHEDQNEEIRFAPDRKLTDLLNGLKGLGQVLNHDSQDIANRQDGLLKTRGMKKYPINDASDLKDCDINSSCVLKDGTVILSDRINKRLIRLDRSNYNVRDQFIRPVKPWQVCVISNEEVAVSYRQKEILFISLGINMTKQSAIKTDFDCHGLAYADGNLYISNYNSSVCIYSVSGKRLKQFTKNESGQPLFSCTYFHPINSISVSTDGLKIYIADSVKGMIVLNNYGQVIGNYNGPELDGAYDVYVTVSGVALVCGYNSKNVLQFEPSGELIGEILKCEGDKRFSTVCCNQEMSKMIVGRTDSNEIEVYNLV